MPHITRATPLFLSVNTSLGRHRAGINLAYLSKVSNYLVYLINRTRRILKWFCEIQRGLISLSLEEKENKSLVESLISLFNQALIRSNRGTSYTWYLVRLQEGKKRGGGGCISLSRGRGERTRLRQRQHKQTELWEVWVRRVGIWAPRAPPPPSTMYLFTMWQIHTSTLMLHVILPSTLTPVFEFREKFEAICWFSLD